MATSLTGSAIFLALGLFVVAAVMRRPVAGVESGDRTATVTDDPVAAEL